MVWDDNTKNLGWTGPTSWNPNGSLVKYKFVLPIIDIYMNSPTKVTLVLFTQKKKKGHFGTNIIIIITKLYSKIKI